MKLAPSVTGSRRAAAREATRERLHQAALELFWEKGYNATSTRDVATSMGVRQASLYYHMESKEKLLHGICYSSFATLIERAEAAVAIARTPHEAIREIARNHLTTTITFQKEFSVGVIECRALGPEYRVEIEGLWARYHMLTSSVFDDAKAAGQIRNDMANKYLYMPLWCTMIWTVLWYRQGKELNISQFDQIFASVYFEGAGTAEISRNYRSSAIRKRLESLSSPVALVSPTLKNATYTRLLDTACALFARKGYNATTIREIADAMKVRKASLYYYISGKDDLMYEISKAALEHLTAGVQWVLEEAVGPAERLYAFIIAHIVSLLQHQNWHATSNEELVTYTAERRKEIVALRDKYELIGRTLLQEAQAAGIIRSDIPVKYLSLLLFGMITNIYPWYRPKVDVTPPELGFMLADLFLTGIAPQWPAAIS